MYKLMPVEPTEEIVRAMTASLNHDGLPPADDPGDPDYTDDMRRAYNAATAAAAPSPWRPIEEAEGCKDGDSILAWISGSHTLEIDRSNPLTGHFEPPDYTTNLLTGRPFVGSAAVSGSTLRAMLMATILSMLISQRAARMATRQ